VIDSIFEISDAAMFQKHASGDGMKSILHPWQILLLVLAGWINRQQQNTIEYLIAENQILREKLGKKRILLSNDQRPEAAVSNKGQDFGKEGIGRNLRHCRAGNNPSLASKIRRGAIIESREHWRILGMKYQTQPLAKFSRHAGLSRCQNEGSRRPGRTLFKPIGTFWQPLTSRQLRFGLRVG
jgi:hypothetical protein